MRAVQPPLRSHMRPSSVHTYGFRSKANASDVVGWHGNCYIFSAWKLPLATSVQDGKTAFDSMPHDLTAKSLLYKGAPCHDVGIQVRELSKIHACFSVPAAGLTQLFDYGRGGKQGSVETSDQWRAVVYDILDPVV